MILTCRESRMLTESNSRPGSIFIPTISGAIIEKRRQHCNRGDFSEKPSDFSWSASPDSIKCLNRESYLQTFCSAIRNLPTMILIWECPRTFGNVAIHAFKVTRRIVLDLQDFRQYEVNRPWETQVDSGWSKEINYGIQDQTWDSFMNSCPFLSAGPSSSVILQASSAWRAKLVSHSWLQKLCNNRQFQNE